MEQLKRGIGDARLSPSRRASVLAHALSVAPDDQSLRAMIDVVVGELPASYEVRIAIARALVDANRPQNTLVAKAMQMEGRAADARAYLGQTGESWQFGAMQRTALLEAELGHRELAEQWAQKAVDGDAAGLKWVEEQVPADQRDQLRKDIPHAIEPVIRPAILPISRRPRFNGHAVILRSLLLPTLDHGLVRNVVLSGLAGSSCSGSRRAGMGRCRSTGAALRAHPRKVIRAPTTISDAFDPNAASRPPPLAFPRRPSRGRLSAAKRPSVS